MASAPESDSVLSVPPWTDRLSGLQSRHPRFFIGLGNLESRLLAERLGGITIEKPIWVTGLARSGTTILLEMLARHPLVATHRYRDFPPVLSPWFWNWFVDRAGESKHASAERAHGDGIEVTPESPEAFEEVVWMAFFRDLHNPDVGNQLDADSANSEFESFYRAHLRKVLAIRGGSRYVAKANYNLTRLPYLLKLFPDARFVLPFRDPVWQIASLERQHEHFCIEHKRDVKLQRHMSRAGHFEFGLDRRPVNHGDDETNRKVRELWSTGHDVEGWALYWMDLHQYVVDTLESDTALRRATMLVDYDRFCREPEAIMRTVLAHCGLPNDNDVAGHAARTVRQPSYYRLPFDEKQKNLITTIAGPVYEKLCAMASSDADSASP